MKQPVLLTFLLFTMNYSFGQSLNKSYEALWGGTLRTYELHSDNSFKFYVSGHGGSFDLSGQYQIAHDTIFFSLDSTTYVKLFKLDGDSCIIDLDNLWEYKLLTTDETTLSECEVRYDILPKINWDSTIVVSLDTFNMLVNEATKVLKDQYIGSISKNDHITIIRILNTLQSDHSELKNSNPYQSFIQLIEENKYEKELQRYFSDWTPGRGMGYYFKLLQIEFGGTPHLYSRFIIRE